MTAPLIAPLIPPRARLDGREHGRSATARLPPPRVLTVPDGVVYGFGRMPLLAAIWIWICQLAATKKTPWLSQNVTGFAGRERSGGAISLSVRGWVAVGTIIGTSASGTGVWPPTVSAVTAR
jgi:hypothetical protein